ncbi:hypothetical protein WK92_25705 [Burkholderia ubonensis]|nr:hypothetical protein WK82_23310 [Burkholderia ubonensis]KVW31185.1 hypothetical protein WK92_25705 [Burkholderia ubonensis]
MRSSLYRESNTGKMLGCLSSLNQVLTLSVIQLVSLRDLFFEFRRTIRGSFGHAVKRALHLLFFEDLNFVLSFQCAPILLVWFLPNPSQNQLQQRTKVFCRVSSIDQTLTIGFVSELWIPILRN